MLGAQAFSMAAKMRDLQEFFSVVTICLKRKYKLFAYTHYMLSSRRLAKTSGFLNFLFF